MDIFGNVAKRFYVEFCFLSQHFMKTERAFRIMWLIAGFFFHRFWVFWMKKRLFMTGLSQFWNKFQSLIFFISLFKIF